MPSIDLLDISHYQTITDWSAIPSVPIVHKVCEGGRADSRWLDRRDRIVDHHQIAGGYVVLWPNRPGKISIADQMAAYFELVEPVWRDGFVTQLDVEPWDYLSGRDRCSADEVIEARQIHIDHFGRPPLIYINPRQMPQVHAELAVSLGDGLNLWEPHYGRGGETVAKANLAVIHQWTSSAQVPGFSFGVDANTILRPDRLNRCAGLDQQPTPNPEPTPVPTIPPPHQGATLMHALAAKQTGTPTVWVSVDGGRSRFAARDLAHLHNIINAGDGVLNVATDGTLVAHPDEIAATGVAELDRLLGPAQG